MKRMGSVLHDSFAGMAARPGRVLLTALGATIGIASLVAIAGLTTTASAQILERFDTATPTQITVEIASADAPSDGQALDWAAADNVRSLSGVVAATCVARVDRAVHVSALELAASGASDETPYPIYAADQWFADTMSLRLAAGRTFDRGHVVRGDRVVLLGAAAADRLGVSDLRRHRVVFLGSQPFAILGIFDRSPADPAALSGVVVPSGTGVEALGVLAPDLVRIRVVAGAVSVVARQAALALNPVDPDRLVVEHAPEPRRLREQVSEDTRELFLVVALVSTLAGAVGIMNTMLVNVLERRFEIGLRRAVGARRGEILLQFLTESAIVGVLAGIVGTSVGSAITVLVAAYRGWTPTAEWWVPLVGVLLGSVTGTLAGVLPSYRAANIEPATALRTA